MLSAEGFKFIQSEEGCKLHAYLDTLANPHVWTIGWGETLNVKPGMVWTQQQANAAFKTRLYGFFKCVDDNATFHPLPYETDALISFSYNVGKEGFKGSNLLEYLNKNARIKWDNKHIIDLFLNWAHPTSLERRRKREATLFLTGDYGIGP